MFANARPPLRIVVVGEDEIDGAGCEAILARRREVDDIVGLGHDEARAVASWIDVGIVVIDPVDARCADDQLTGISLIEHIRTERGRGAIRIVVVTSAPREDPVRLRAREAGADAYLHRSRVSSADQLAGLVLSPDQVDSLAGAANPETLRRLGVTRQTRVNAGVAAAFHEQLVSGTGWVGPRGRDRFARRLRFNERARLRPLSVDGLPPDRHQTVPSLAQIQRFVAWATQVAALSDPQSQTNHQGGAMSTFTECAQEVSR